MFAGGTAVKRSAYSTLFSAISTIFVVGNGPTTFTCANTNKKHLAIEPLPLTQGASYEVNQSGRQWLTPKLVYLPCTLSQQRYRTFTLLILTVPDLIFTDPWMVVSLLTAS